MPFYEDPNPSALEPVEVVGNVAAGATDSGNPIKIGGVYRSSPSALTNGQRGDALMTAKGELRVSLTDGTNGAPIVSVGSDGASASGNALGVYAYNALFNGATYDRWRTANVFKVVNVAITTGTPQTVWTPAAGKKIRLMGYSLSGSAGGNVRFFDNTGGATEIFRAPKGATLGLNFSPPNMGNGILLSSANNVLQIDSDVSSTFQGTVFGTEE